MPPPRGLGDRLARWWRATTTPPPRSGPTSFHLWWDGWERRDSPVVEVRAVLEVLEEPVDDHLRFWALQASFTDAGGRPHGAAHLGLQWYAPAPDHRAANWGGYASPPASEVLAGTENALAGFSTNENTRTYPWQAGAAYGLRVFRGGAGWAGEITDLERGEAVVLRELLAGGDRLASPVVWSEVFAPCGSPPTAVRWSGLATVTADGTERAVGHVRCTFPGAGSCRDTDVVVDAVGVVQRTGVTRTTPDGAHIPLPHPNPS